ncbi:D-alanine--D-alanine ligase [Clostridia bacterium]|nr:D-alanine--D-alanine ligase [Clostridia bacterium]
MKLTIGLFFGGMSVEHEISVISGLQAYAAFDREKYNIIPVYIAKDMCMYAGGDVADIKKYADASKIIKTAKSVTLGANGVILDKRGKQFGKIDLAFPVVHGTNVEDGALQGYFQTLCVPYCGCDVLSSALGMDKASMKYVLAAAGVRVLPCTVVRLEEYISGRDSIVASVERQYTYPVIVKPVNLGSSIGIKLARDRAELYAALDLALMFAPTALVERAVTAIKEVNVSVLGDPDFAEASECEEPVATDGILGYSDKYENGGNGKGKLHAAKLGGIGSTKLTGTVTGAKSVNSAGMSSLSRKIPADITEQTREEIRETAVRAFRALGCSGVSRLDFIIDTDSGDIYLNEINTIPGSLAFYLWQPTGVDYTALLDRVVDIALKRERVKRSLNFSFDTNILARFS